MVGHNTFWSINAGPLSGFQVTAGRERERERQVVMTSLPVASALRSRREIGIR